MCFLAYIGIEPAPPTQQHSERAKKNLMWIFLSRNDLHTWHRAWTKLYINAPQCWKWKAEIYASCPVKNALKSDINLAIPSFLMHYSAFKWQKLQFFLSRLSLEGGGKTSEAYVCENNWNHIDRMYLVVFNNWIFLSLLSLQNLKDQILTTNIWLEHEWQDHKFKWDPLEYGGVTELYVPSEHIWWVG